MRYVGGYFPFEELPEEENHFLENLTPEEGELGFFMSGRCANYHCLLEIKRKCKKMVAYVPIYTCETVLFPFLKAGFELKFYHVTKDMELIFEESALDEIGVISICGYFGFCRYDRDFVKRCSERGIYVIEDVTHSLFSEGGIDPSCDYVVGSLRKWLGVPAGGFAISKKCKFALPAQPIDEKHLTMRKEPMMEKLAYDQRGEEPSTEAAKRIYDTMWAGELYLRQIFANQESDAESIRIIKHYDFEKMKKIRRRNYEYLLEHMPREPRLTVVFPELPDGVTPSHFTFYIEKRDEIEEYMGPDYGVSSTSYWPRGPMVDTTGNEDANYIYDHVLSVPCDQRWTLEDMEHVCQAIRDLPF